MGGDTLVQHQSQYTPQKEYCCFHCLYIYSCVELVCYIQYTFLRNLSSNSKQSDIDSFLYVVNWPLLTTYDKISINSGYRSQ